MIMITAQEARDRTDMTLSNPVRAELRLIEDRIVQTTKEGLDFIPWAFGTRELPYMQEVISTLTELGYTIKDSKDTEDSSCVMIIISW